MWNNSERKHLRVLLSCLGGRKQHNLSAMKQPRTINGEAGSSNWRSDNKNIIDFKELVLNSLEIMVNGMNI